MIIYEILCDNDTLSINKNVNGQILSYDQTRAINILQRLDNRIYTKAKVKDNGIVLINESSKIVIKNIDNFLKNGYGKYLSRNLNRVQKTVLNKSKLIDPFINRYRNTDKKVIAFNVATTLLILSLSIPCLKSLLNDKEIKDIESETITEENNQEVLSEVDIETIKKISSIQKLLNENNIDLTNDVVEEQDMIDIYNNVEQVKQANLSDIKAVKLSFDETVDNDFVNRLYDEHYETALKYANKWGVSPNLIMAMLTQESGGREVNLMQIQFDSWKDQVLKAYDFESNVTRYYVLTNNPKNYKNQDVMCITESDLTNPKTNISVACIILRNSCMAMKYNLIAGIQCYNYGIGNMETILDLCAKDNNTTKEEILNDPYNTSYLNYRFLIQEGDSNYLENVIRYVKNLDEGISLKYLNNGEVHTTKLQIENQLTLPKPKAM